MNIRRHMNIRTLAHARGVFAALTAAALLGMAGCASAPNVRSDYDHGVDFARYRTFGFPAQTGTDRGGYSTLTTAYFKDAVTREMQARGYRLQADNPDLIVNFYTNVRERTEAVASAFAPGWGYYGYRWGLYAPWPYYEPDFQSRTYKVGTVNVDVVDAHTKQMVWEGITEGTISEDAMRNPRAAISTAVANVFTQYPAKQML